MNKQELIEAVIKLPIDASGPRPKVDHLTTLELIKLLDEPEKGHADEAPRYVKNVLARLRELPLHDREVWLKAIMSEFEQDFSHAKWREGYEQGKLEGMVEREKVTIPQFVADWIEEAREITYNIRGAIEMAPNERVKDWLELKNVNIFAEAWVNGYAVEKEKRYQVSMKGIDTNFNFLNRHRNENYWIFSSKDKNTLYQTHHTREELEEANFGWVFDCPGIEIEEVE